MLLETIRSPADLRDLDPQELEELAGEIRDFIVAAVAENSGHLGSNLGAVELTLALHRVFDSPRDAIIWYTGSPRIGSPWTYVGPHTKYLCASVV